MTVVIHDAPDINGWPLPPEPYVPGVTERPCSGVIFEISHAAPDVTDPAKWRTDRAWLSGFRLYDSGYFWETHEVWEPVWMGARPNSVERGMVQGLIQTANACLKLAMGRPKAALRLTEIAAGCLRDACFGDLAIVMGLDVASAYAETVQFVARLADAQARLSYGGEPASLIGDRPNYPALLTG